MLLRILIELFLTDLNDSIIKSQGFLKFIALLQEQSSVVENIKVIRVETESLFVAKGGLVDFLSIL